jgi:hypothetical protein
MPAPASLNSPHGSFPVGSNRHQSHQSISPGPRIAQPDDSVDQGSVRIWCRWDEPCAESVSLEAKARGRCGLGDAKGPGGGTQDRCGVTQVGVDVVGRALRGAGEQRTGVGQHQRIAVDVDDPAVRRHPLGDLARVIHRGQAGTDVQELADPASLARNRTARARKYRAARAASTICGKSSRYWSPAARSTA